MALATIKSEMKNIKHIILLIAFVFLTKLLNAQNIFSDKITFTIDWVEESGRINMGSWYIHPTKNYSYVFIYITLSNLSDSKQMIDFTKFSLLDNVKTIRYKPQFIMGAGTINVMKSDRMNLSKGKQKRRRLVFLFPEYQKANSMLVNGVKVELE